MGKVSGYLCFLVRCSISSLSCQDDTMKTDRFKGEVLMTLRGIFLLREKIGDSIFADMKRNWLEEPVQYVKGVGPKRSLVLAKLGIRTVGDFLYHFPRRYEDRSRIIPIKDVRIGEVQVVSGKVLARGVKKTWKGINILRVAIDDGTGIIYAAWFNQPYLEKQFPVGSKVILSGKVDIYKDIQIVNPAYEVLGDEQEVLEAGCIVPIYPLTKDINQRQMRKIYRSAIDRFSPCIAEFLPYSIRKRHKLVNLPLALRKIHFPEAESDWNDARKRLIFDEFFLLQLALARRKHGRLEKQGIRHVSGGRLFEKFKEMLPFPLTGAQLRVVEEIRNDMAKPRPMTRLVQGEVGSGKTIVAIGASLTAVESGYQTALMVPTEILAGQHFLTIQKLLLPLGLRINLLMSSLSQKMREETMKEIENGESHITIGTHALLEEKVRFPRLGLVVVDEQHKFGVKQRETLRKKGLESTDLLMMSATPIPRSLAMTVYGDLDISTIDELPPGRKEIHTYLVSEEERSAVYDFIREEVTLGRQAYIVYPLIEESATLHLKAAAKMAEYLKMNVFPEFRIGLLHGQMKEKEEVMQSFKEREIDILISTTVIEVGVDVPNASVMVVENAERFGLAQLHQMRGRIGRGDYESFCILVGEPGSEEARKRLEVLTQTSDGFQIAEEDLELRGPGEFFGTRQHGMPELKLANIADDMKLLEIAREEAFSILSQDPGLDEPGHRNLKMLLKEKSLI